MEHITIDERFDLEKDPDMHNFNPLGAIVDIRSRPQPSLSKTFASVNRNGLIKYHDLIVAKQCDGLSISLENLDLLCTKPDLLNIVELELTEFTDCQDTAVDMRNLKIFPNVQHLTIDSEKSIDILKYFPNLKFLTIGNWNAGSASLLDNACSSIEGLNISGFNDDVSTLPNWDLKVIFLLYLKTSDIIGLEKFKHLETLRLQTPKKIFNLSSISSFKQLKNLSFDGPKTTQIPIDALNLEMLQIEKAEDLSLLEKKSLLKYLEIGRLYGHPDKRAHAFGDLSTVGDPFSTILGKVYGYNYF